MAVTQTTNTAKNTSDAFAENAVQIICAFRDYIDIVIHNRNQQKEIPPKKSWLQQIKARITGSVENKKPIFDPIPSIEKIDDHFSALNIETHNWEDRLNGATHLIPKINTSVIENKTDLFTFDHLDALISSADFIKDYQDNEANFNAFKEQNPRLTDKKNQQKNEFINIDRRFKIMVYDYRKETQNIPDLTPKFG